MVIIRFICYQAERVGHFQLFSCCILFIRSSIPPLRIFCIYFSTLQLESSILSVLCVLSYMFYTLFPPSPSLSLPLCVSFLAACVRILVGG